MDWDGTQNVFIEGENLEVLKLLQKSYQSSVKMIYIDPPYNTGNDFIYPDNYRDSMGNYLRLSGQVSAEGQKLTTNPETGGRYHSNWLSMMYPRLFLARNLLREDGVIFVSIDDHEAENLRCLMDEVFGEENFVATVIWNKVFASKNSTQYFSENHDYILVYSRVPGCWRRRLLPRSAEQTEDYQNPDNDPRGPWNSVSLSARNPYSEGLWSTTAPEGRFIDGPPKGRYWAVSFDKFQELDKDHRIWWGRDGNGIPRRKVFLSEVQAGIVPQTIWAYDEVGNTQEAKKSLLEFVPFDETENVLNSVNRRV